MTSYERIMAAMEFRAPDRLPRWDSYDIFGDFTQRWRRARGVTDDVSPADCYGIDMEIVACKEGAFPSLEGVVGQDGDYELFRDYWGRTVRRRPGDAYFMETIATMLDSKGDLDRLEFEDPAADLRFVDYMEKVEHERAAGRVPCTKIGGVYIRTQFMRREDRLLIDMATDEAFCHELFGRMADHLLEVGLEELRRGDTWDTGIWVFDDFANSRAPMFSPAMWDKYFLPLYSRMIDTWRAAGCKHFFLHSDGNIVPAIDGLLAAGFEGFHPLEPRTGIDPVKLRQKYGKRIVFIGGVCNARVMPRGDKREIEAAVRPLIELGREGGMIIGMHSIGDDISVEAYDYYISLLDKYANYSQA
ncbi:MAG: uroporphyrinogen decarboxylase family protein [Candidatus Brocadiia bacterium]|jgi:uroporphyrinogen decarboxylase|nr:uroporphyrinogen decarboxylase family protein [Candidatus Brocadiia bacterium]